MLWLLADAATHLLLASFAPCCCSITGKKFDSSVIQNKITDVTADANRGDYRLMVATTNGIKVGQWVRLFQPAANNSYRRRSLLGAAAPSHLGRKLRQDAPERAEGKVTVLGGGNAAAAADRVPAQQTSVRPPIPQWYEDPTLQAGLEAAVNAEWDIAEALAENPDKVRGREREAGPAEASWPQRCCGSGAHIPPTKQQPPHCLTPRTPPHPAAGAVPGTGAQRHQPAGP